MQENQYMSEQEEREEAEVMSKVGLKYREPVGRTIQKIRESKGMTRKHLADAVGGDCSESDIAKYENGSASMTMTTFFSVAEALNVTPNDLVPDYWKNVTHALPSDYFSLTDGNKRKIDDVISAFLDQQKHLVSG